MPDFLLCHQHEPTECPVVFAAWSGFQSPLRHAEAVGACVSGDHRLWWSVSAASPHAALSLLPEYLVHRTECVPVSGVPIP